MFIQEYETAIMNLIDRAVTELPPEEMLMLIQTISDHLVEVRADVDE